MPSSELAGGAGGVIRVVLRRSEIGVVRIIVLMTRDRNRERSPDTLRGVSTLAYCTAPCVVDLSNGLRDMAAANPDLSHAELPIITITCIAGLNISTGNRALSRSRVQTGFRNRRDVREKGL
jgi:hypothetical protein